MDNSMNKNDLPQETPEMRSILIRSTPKLPEPLARLPKKPSAALRSPLQSNSARSLDWNPKAIPKVPEYYPLGRSRVTVDCDVCEVASRIGACLRQHELSVTFEENTALCVTPCHTHFTVTIFENEEHYIVEVQRKTGCSFVCQQFCRAVLKAAKGSTTAPMKKPQFSIPASVLKMDQHQDEKAFEDDVTNALHLINQERYDSQMLGMNALASITSKRKVVLESSQFGFLKRILSARSPHARKHDTEAKLRLDALTVLANLLTHKSIDCEYVIENELLQLLVMDLTNDDLNASYQSARCMTAMCSCCPQFKENIAAMGAATAAEELEELAKARHQPLENQIRLLRVELEE